MRGNGPAKLSLNIGLFIIVVVVGFCCSGEMNETNICGKQAGSNSKRVLSLSLLF